MIALLIVCIGIGFAGYAAFNGDRLGCVVEALLGVLWLWVNKPVEGPILVTLSPTHGITLADLFSVGCFVLALSGWNRQARGRVQPRTAPPQPRTSRRH